MKAQFRNWIYICGLILIGAIFLPQFASAQGTMSGDSVIYQGVVIDGYTRKPWCKGEVRVMNKLKIKGAVEVDANGHFRLAVSSTIAALPNLRFVAIRDCTPGGNAEPCKCFYEEPAADRSQQTMRIIVGGECYKCGCD